MTIPGIARRLIAKYGREYAEDKAFLQSLRHEYGSGRDAFWRSVARACLRVPAPEATP
jgi:hypothetical protein